jgi:hypothetical protein
MNTSHLDIIIAGLLLLAAMGWAVVFGWKLHRLFYGEAMDDLKNKKKVSK